jgi:hypothetical protein
MGQKLRWRSCLNHSVSWDHTHTYIYFNLQMYLHISPHWPFTSHDYIPPWPKELFWVGGIEICHLQSPCDSLPVDKLQDHALTSSPAGHVLRRCLGRVEFCVQKFFLRRQTTEVPIWWVTLSLRLWVHTKSDEPQGISLLSSTELHYQGELAKHFKWPEQSNLGDPHIYWETCMYFMYPVRSHRDLLSSRQKQPWDGLDISKLAAGCILSICIRVQQTWRTIIWSTTARRWARMEGTRTMKKAALCPTFRQCRPCQP